MNILGIDTALGACSAALTADARVVAHAFEEMQRGHAEALAPMVDALMRNAGLSYAALNRIAVTTGPGTFTGQRVGLAFARAMALALKIPAVGVTTLDVMAEVAYGWNLNNVRGQREQELTANLAVGWPVSRWFTPFLELNTVTMIQGAVEENSPGLRGRTQIYLTPGFNVRPLPGVTLRAGVELPASGARAFDYRVRSALVWEF